MPFNEKQQEAIDLSIEDDALIAAAAGSGKTKVLSERVYRLINDNKIKPSELLVLTFTNNAAHEMKTRIISNFKENGKDELAEEMKSCHVQTFDSFSKYLVTKYAGILGIASSISIVDETIFNLKRTSYLDEVIEDYYNNDFDRIVNVFKKFSTNGDSVIKKIILDIDKRLSQMSDAKRNNIVNNYYDVFLSRAKFNELFDDFINYYKDYIIDVLLNQYFLDRNYNINNKSINEINDILNDSSNFNHDYDDLRFTNDFTNDIYLEIVEMLKYNSIDFLNAVKRASTDSLFDPKEHSKEYQGDKEEKDYYRKIHKTLCNLFQKNGNANPKLSALLNINNVDDFYNSYLCHKDTILLIMEIIKKVDDKILDYKKSSNCYTFLDISKLTNELLSNPKYIDTQDEIRKQFKYIMVDEYQDSNDFQEILLDSLMTKTKDGSQSHLFCVGDVKQSIYAFRNSNVELFRGRQERYKNSSNPNEKVIDMNLNYRSCEALLKDINTLFEGYMRLDNGGINYANNDEQLHYDHKANLYNLDYPDAGCHRIVCKNYSSAEWEALAILADIKTKISEGFKVYDKNSGIRECTYSDFAIITRTKSGFNMYQRLFYEHGVPLNNKLPSILTDVDAIITLQSLITLIDAKINEKFADINHLFASLARSYIFEYDDDKIYNIIKEDKVSTDPIMVKIDEFKEKHNDSEFDDIFLDALIEFKIIEKLNLIGDISDNISKIESLYALIINNKNIGEGISEFVDLFKTLAKNKLELKDEVNISLENAVDMMTIHASKGLERKIVYLPAHFNSYTRNNKDKADYEFSSDCGLILRNYDLPIDESVHKTTSFLDNYNDLFSTAQKVDYDEFVRLMYVAFTRAENICYVVGRNKQENNKYPCIGKVYDNLPFFYETEFEYLDKMQELSVIDSNTIVAYYDSIDKIKEASKINIPNTDKYNIKLFINIRDSIFKKMVYQNHLYIVNEISKKLYEYYKLKLNDAIANLDYDILAKIYAEFNSIPNINSFDDYYSYILKEYDTRMLDGVEDGEDQEFDPDAKVSSDYNVEELEEMTEDVAKNYLVEFSKKIYSEEIFGIETEDEKIEKRHLNAIDVLTPFYVYVFDNEMKFMIKSYALNGFRDYKYFPNFDILIDEDDDTDDDKDDKAPDLTKYKLKINDGTFNFKERRKFRASINLSSDKDITDVLEYGIYLHHLLELVDFKNVDTSFIQDAKAKEYIDNILKLQIFNNLNDANIYKEYGYYDDDFDTTGFIDLLYEKNGIYYIIDYKSSDISKEGYINQLHIYQRNIMKLFNVDKKHIKLYLVSILNCELKEIEVE